MNIEKDIGTTYCLHSLQHRIVFYTHTHVFGQSVDYRSLSSQLPPYSSSNAAFWANLTASFCHCVPWKEQEEDLLKALSYFILFRLVPCCSCNIFASCHFILFNGSFILKLVCGVFALFAGKPEKMKLVVQCAGKLP